MLPAEHGAWVFLLSPLAIGLVLGERFPVGSLLVVIGALAAFLVRQPLTIIVKVLSGRRQRSELGAAQFWLIIYGVFGLLAVAGLLWLGNAFILLLAIPAVPVFAWHLWLVSRRAERHQMLVELAGGAVLALVAPAAFWVGKGQYDPLGWLLWALAWMQTAGSIVYTYLRLKQRKLSSMPEPRERLAMGMPALVTNTAILLLVVGSSIASLTPPWLPLAYAIQWIEVLWGIAHPAVRVKPAKIGVRQLVVSTLFTLVFILTWM
jgi:hypothetical protein